MIHIGILGAAWIAPLAVIEPAKTIGDITAHAIAARDHKRAVAFAEEHGLAHVEQSYETLLARSDIDLIYIALPASAHRQWAEAALYAGKHVLCEKPLAMNAKEARDMAAAAHETNKLLIEAFHYRHHPYFNRVLEIVNGGEVGRIQRIYGRLHVPVKPREGQIRHDPALGGGALMDLGCYPIHMARTITGEEPRVMEAYASVGPTGVDLAIKATLAFPGGSQAIIDCAMPEAGELEGALIIEGSAGRLTASRPILPHHGGVIAIETPRQQSEETTDARSTYAYQLEAVARFIRGEEAPFPSLDDSIANASALDAIRAAAA